MLTLTGQRGHTWELTAHLENINIRKPRWSNRLVPPSTDNSQCSVRVPVNSLNSKDVGEKTIVEETSQFHNF